MSHPQYSNLSGNPHPDLSIAASSHGRAMHLGHTCAGQALASGRLKPKPTNTIRVLPRTCRASAMASDNQTEEPWRLYYWPGIKGRGEFVRLVFEEAGVPYVEPAQKRTAGATLDLDNPEVKQFYPDAKAFPVEHGTGYKLVSDWVWHGGNQGFPVRAPPAIQREAYLGRKYGLYPASLEEQALVDQTLAIVTDAIAEGRLAFHPKDHYASHRSQVEESKPYIKQYGEQRLPKYMGYFESILARATPQEEGQRFLISNMITVADLTVYQYLAAAQQHYKEYYDACDAPLCKAFQVQIASRPRIAAYLKSDRCQPWDEDSMM